MKERPILFSGPMIRAILGGRKTQTRRVVRMCRQFADWNSTPAEAYDVILSDLRDGAHFLVAGDHGFTDFVPCPYGGPGDRLWVRETFFCITGEPGPTACCYRADESDENQFRGLWAPSIFMPRWAGRITLEVTGIRVEKLQEIGEVDAAAEGLEELVPRDNRGEGLSPGALAMAAAAAVAAMPKPTRRDFLRGALAAALGFAAGKKPWEASEGPLLRAPTPREVFAIGWDSINGKRVPWESDPWVWVVEFKVVKP